MEIKRALRIIDPATRATELAAYGGDCDMMKAAVDDACRCVVDHYRLTFGRMEGPANGGQVNKSPQDAGFSEKSGAVRDPEQVKTGAAGARMFTFEDMVRATMATLELGIQKYDDAFCVECKKTVGGNCPVHEDRDCPFSDEEVIRWYWNREMERRILDG